MVGDECVLSTAARHLALTFIFAFSAFFFSPLPRRQIRVIFGGQGSSSSRSSMHGSLQMLRLPCGAYGTCQQSRQLKDDIL